VKSIEGLAPHSVPGGSARISHRSPRIPAGLDRHKAHGPARATSPGSRAGAGPQRPEGTARWTSEYTPWHRRARWSTVSPTSVGIRRIDTAHTDLKSRGKQGPAGHRPDRIECPTIQIVRRKKSGWLLGCGDAHQRCRSRDRLGVWPAVRPPSNASPRFQAKRKQTPAVCEGEASDDLNLRGFRGQFRFHLLPHRRSRRCAYIAQADVNSTRHPQKVRKCLESWCAQQK